MARKPKIVVDPAPDDSYGTSANASELSGALPPVEIQMEEITNNPNAAKDAAEPVDQGALEQYKTWFRADRDHSAPWRKEAKEDFEFLAMKQYTDEERQQLKDQHRPAITFDRTGPIIGTISGLEISNRQEVKFYPRQAGNANADEVLTNAVEWFRDLSNADDEDSDMFADAVVCGLGGTETTISFDEEREGVPSVSCMNPLEIYWDHSARRKNYTDSNRRWRVRDIPIAKLKAMFPEADSSDFDADWAAQDGDDGEPIDRERARMYADDGTEDFDIDETMATIVHLQHKQLVTVYDVKDLMSGKSQTVSAEDYKELKSRYDDLRKMKTPGVPPPVWTFTPRQAYQIITCFIGSKILMSTTALCPNNFSFQLVTGYLDRNTGLPYGMMRRMKDPQRWSNKWMSQGMHILNTNAKGGVVAEEDIAENMDEFKDSWAHNDQITIVAAGALSGGAPKFQAKTQPDMSAPFFNMMSMAIDAVPQVTGVSVELQGLRQADQPASLEQMRKQSGIEQLAPLFDNLKRYRRDQGKVMLYILQKVIPEIDQAQGNPPRLVRIEGQEGAQYVPLAIAADVKYDIIVDDQVETAEQKTQIWQTLLPFYQTFPPQVQLALLDYSPLPPSAIVKVRQAAMAAMQPDPAKVQAAQQAQQLAFGQQQAEIGVKQSQAAKNQADAAKTASEIGRQEPQQAPQAPVPTTQLQDYATLATANKDNSVAELNFAKAEQARTMNGDNVVSGAPGASPYQQ